MTQDVLIKQDSNGLFDLQIVDQDFAGVDGFESALVVSLFTDSRAPSSAVQSAENRRGWVGDVLTSNIGRALGSLLWTYDQSRLTREILNQVGDAAQNALLWMVEDGIIKDVQATVTQETKRGIVVNIKLITPDGKNQEYAALWRATSNI